MKIIFKMKGRVLLILLMCNLNISFGQKTDSLEIELIIKTALLTEAFVFQGSVINVENIQNFYSCDIEIKELDSKGFTDIKFFKVELPICSYDDFKEFPKNVTSKFCDGFVIGINMVSRETFKLKGFQNNNFQYLLEQFYIFKNEDVNSKRKFLKNFYVESLNLKCLFEYNRERNLKNIKDYPCRYEPCAEMLITR